MMRPATYDRRLLFALATGCQLDCVLAHWHSYAVAAAMRMKQLQAAATDDVHTAPT